MKKYSQSPKDALEEKLDERNPRLNYYHLYASAVLTAYDALESLEALNIGEAKTRLRSVCRTAERLHTLRPEK